MDTVVQVALDYGGWAAFVGLGGLVWVLLLRGDVVPGSTARMWLESWQAERTAGRERDRQLVQLLENQETANKLIRALHSALTGVDDDE